MKKLHKASMDMRISCFLLLIIITVCGLYYSLVRKTMGKPLMGEEAKAADESEIRESYAQMGDIVVEISGAVAHPGVYHMATGDTVGMLVEAAGGFLEDADSSCINLSDSIFHMEQVVIGALDSEPTAQYSADLVSMYYPPPQKEETLIAESQKININTATSQQLQRLPGIGPKIADSIVEYRTEHGDFQTIENLMDVPKIGEKTFAALADYITVSTE